MAIWPSSADIAVFTETFAASHWHRVEVMSGTWELRLARSACAVPGFCSPVSLEVGSVDLDRCIPIVAPHLATVRHAPPGSAEPYVALGDRVSAETCVFGLEVMRRQSALRAGVEGVLRRICVADGALVEAGQALGFVEPAR